MIAVDQPTIFDKRKVRVAVSSKQDGNTRPELTTLDESKAAVGKLAVAVNLPMDRIAVMSVVAHQDTWDEIVDVTDAQGDGLAAVEDRIPADALVTNVPDVGLLLSVADCNAVAIHDPVRNVLAVVHLGWQSTVVDLATKVIQHLQRKYQSSANDLRIYVSPSIRAESYVFDHVRQQKDPVWKDFLQVADKGIGVDLPGFNRQRFIDVGVLPEHIEVCSANTATSDNYFSHYRSVRTGEPEGRFALLARLVG